ncbi:MAG: response regulator [Phycisphaeraceae bacterium]|nr:MAG: response regulator [Phycisphaeraceae bacterium]
MSGRRSFVVVVWAIVAAALLSVGSWTWLIAPRLHTEDAKAEATAVDGAVKRAMAAIESLARELEATCEDWSAWDAMYEYAETRNEEFRHASLSVGSVVGIGLSRLRVVDGSGREVYHLDVDCAAGEAVEHPGPVASPDPAEDGSWGPVLIVGPDGSPSVACAKPIRRSDGTGPVHGRVEMHRPIFDEVASRLDTLAGAHVHLIVPGSTPPASAVGTTSAVLPLGPLAFGSITARVDVDVSSLRESARSRSESALAFGVLQSFIACAVCVAVIVLRARSGVAGGGEAIGWWPVVGVGIIGLALTGIVTILTHRVESDGAKDWTERRRGERLAEVARVISEGNGRLSAWTAFVASSPALAPQAFAAYHRAWSGAVIGRVAWAKSQNIFGGWSLVVDVAAPTASTAGVIGVDLLIDDGLRDAAVRARDSGEPAAGAVGHNLLGARNADAIVLLAPVYRGGLSPRTLSDRRESFEGVVAVELKLSALLSGGPDFIGAITLADDPDEADATVDVLDQRLGLVFPRHDLSPAEAPRASVATGIGGVLLTTASVWLAASFTRRHGRVRAEVASRTRELLAANDSLRVALERQRAMSDDLKTAKTAAERADRSKSEFLANMSHEIRTPMTAILGFAELLEQGEIDPREQHSLVSSIRLNGEHLLTVINDILDVSKIEAGAMTIESIPTSPLAIATEAAAVLRGRAAEKGLDLSVRVEGEIPDRVLSDPTRVRQVLVNLMGNAVKFTDRGSVSVVVSAVRPTGDGGPVIEYRVRDTGCGMTPDELERIGRPFTQADSSVTRKYGGTGLGLSICHRLAGLLGGGLVGTSRKGEGSEFRFSLTAGEIPGEPWSHPDGIVGPDRLGETLGLSAEPRRVTRRLRGRILLVEDGPDNRRLISHVLTRAGAQVECATNGREAVEKVLAARSGKSAFSLILMDMQMPEMDGYQASTTLRKTGFAGAIIALTAHASGSDRGKCLAAGCNDYMTKPIERERLIKACEEWMGAGESRAA